MNIQDYKVKPKLIEILIDSENILESYGEPVKFWMLDHLTLPIYFAFFKAQGDNDIEKLFSLVREIILDKDGKPVLDNEHELPVDLFAAAVVKITENLGKSATKSSL